MKRVLFILLRNPLSVLGLVIVTGIVLAALLADVITPFPEHAGAVVDFVNMNHPPDMTNIFGTDLVGRDLFSRIVFAYRISLMLGAVVLAISVPIGVVIGLVAAYRGGWIFSFRSNEALGGWGTQAACIDVRIALIERGDEVLGRRLMGSVFCNLERIERAQRAGVWPGGRYSMVERPYVIARSGSGPGRSSCSRSWSKI